MSGKLAQSGGAICIDQKQGGPINGDFPFKVSYKCYDLQAKKIDQPVMDAENFEISPADQTPLRAITKEGTEGSTFLVQFPHNIVGIVHSISETAALPMFDGASKSTDVNSGSKKKKRSKKRDSEASESQPDEAAKAAAAAQQAQLQQQMQRPRGPPPPNSVSPNSMYDSQLESIRNEMQSKFNELTQMIASLRRTQATQSNIPLASDILVSSVQRLLRENQIKDQQIAEKKQLLDILNARQSDTRERDALRIQLAELGSKLSAQRQQTRVKNDEQEELSKKIQDLQAEFSLKKVKAESSLNELRRQLDDDKMKQIDELNKQRQEITLNAQKADEELAKVREEFERTLAENKRLKEMKSKDKTQELKNLEKKLPTVMAQAVKGMITGVYGIISANFDEDTDYDGEVIKKAIRTAMQRKANQMLEAIEQDALEDDGDEEEEDGQQQ
ncbi:hypothetical protein TRFO_11118 [Tritrichomonas foetus]|uniref:Uncharacterized protein n=1 Tax=Tritrichomonas foetus TaxID=1144522 RepID=A0A1J4JA32_9EUKA|nr:hypothetical protein TRFO_11118 [Tritrichomonas foetus]|eukprot:OHS94491.1 hypothetical protein TRFO_11118 [Tritrichomonas foetus]